MPVVHPEGVRPVYLKAGLKSEVVQQRKRFRLFLETEHKMEDSRYRSHGHTIAGVIRRQ